MRNALLSTLMLIFLTVFASAPAHAATGKNRTYRFATDLSSSLGVGSGQLYDFINKAMNLIRSETGIKIELKNADSWQNAVEMFVKNQADIILLSGDLNIGLKKKKADLMPLCSYTIRGEPKDAFCLWTAKKQELKSVKDVVGKRYIGDSELYSVYKLVRMRKFLKDNGVDMPLWNVFSAFVKTPNVNSAFIGIGLGTADVAYVASDYDISLKFLNPQILSKVGKTFCSPRIYQRPFLAANKASMSPEDLKAMLDVLRKVADKPEKFEELKQYSSLFRSFKIKFVVAPEVDLSAFEELDAEARKFGWYKEAEYVENFMKDIPPGKTVAIPPPEKTSRKKK